MAICMAISLRLAAASRLLAIALAALATPLLHAQDYPTRAIRFIVPQPPGGPTDTVARMVAQRLSEKWGQPVLVENRPGAGSNIATDMVARSAPDGYTLVVATAQHVVNQFLYPSLPFDPVKDFAPVSLIAKAQMVLVVNPELPVKTVPELIAYAKKQPGKITWAHAGNGGAGHLALELLQIPTGIEVLKVPYKGTQPALTDLLGGQVQVMFDGVVSSLPHIKAGKLRPLAVASLTRSKLLPDVPTLAEQGYPGFELEGPLGLLAPARTPPFILQKLQSEIALMARDPEFEAKMAAMGLQSVGSTPAEFADYIKRESDKLGAVIRAANIKAE
ncbi:tripartite tricarboxylate transporter substrate binding protein [soil metagenome]